MERKHIRIRRDEALRLKFLKLEYRNLILKSIIKTRMLAPVTRFYALSKIQKNHVFLSRWKNYCLITGRGRGITHMFNISRHTLNKQGQQGYIMGFSRNNCR